METDIRTDGRVETGPAITESIIYDRLMTHLDDYNIISPAQAAYQNITAITAPLPITYNSESLV